MSAHNTIDVLKRQTNLLWHEADKDNDYMFVHALAGGRQIEVAAIRAIDSQLILATGHDNDERQAILIAHYTQMVVTFTFLPKKEAKREPIGFVDFKEPEPHSPSQQQ
jgi:hypothetical protein